MEKNCKRAIRRHHLTRLKKVRSGYYGWERFEADAQAIARHRGLVANTARLCSCWMCGNPRKHMQERTIHEVSAIEFAKACENDE